MSSCKIHNVRFYKPKPRAIYCMALRTHEKKLAVSRSDGVVEIWDIKHTLYIERTVPHIPENFSIEGLSWCSDRLFSVGIHGLLIEYDLYKLGIKNRAAVTGEAAYCLDVNCSNSKIAIGTEQGYLNIFTVNEEGILFEKFLDKQEGRIICLKFDVTGDYVVSGSIDAIRVWNVASGHAIHRMTTGRSELNKPTIVWCLHIMSDFTIVSGDSRGRLTFWDGKIGSQIETYQSHKADILALTVSENEDSLYCAGIDPSILNYVKVDVTKGTKKWVRSIQRKIHDHDVRAMALCDNKLYSSGIDGYLACSYHPPKTLLKTPPILQNPCICLSRSARIIMLRYPKYVEIWRLGTTENTDVNYRGMVSLKSEPKKLVIIKRTVKDYDGREFKEGIICSCISDDGKWVLISTNSGTRLYEFDHEDHDELKLVKVNIENKTTPCVQAVFSPHNSQLLVAPATGKLVLYDLYNDENDKMLCISQTIETQSVIEDTITFLMISFCGKFIVAGDPQGNIAVWTKKNNNWISHCKIPKYNSAPTAMAVHPELNLVVTYADNKVLEYFIPKKQLTSFSKKLGRHLSAQWLSRSYPIRNVTFDTRAEHIIILHDDSSIIVINTEQADEQSEAKVPKIGPSSKKNSSSLDDCQQFQFSTVKKYKHLVYFNWLSEDEMVAVEVNPLGLLEQLPPAFVQKTFGRK